MSLLLGLMSNNHSLVGFTLDGNFNKQQAIGKCTFKIDTNIHYFVP